MKQLPSDKYNVAWFKLAEFVARGEKERALALYRLLAHSFEDKALAYQLEGDLLLSFDDDAAVDRYLIAAEVYHNEGRFIESAAVYEHLITLEPNNTEFLTQAIKTYKTIANTSRLVKNFNKVCTVYIKDNNIDALKNVMADIETFTEKSRVEVLQHVCLELIAANHDNDLIESYLARVIDSLLMADDMRLQSLMSMLQAVGGKWYDYARQLIEG